MPKESVEIALTSWDYILRIWAVAGPLLAAGVSAIWSRRNQVQDRIYQAAQEAEKDRKLSEETKRIRAEEAKRNKYVQLQDACIEFMASSHEYVRKQSEYLTHLTPELQQYASEANDRFTNSNQKLILLGDAELTEASIAFWNATIAIPISYHIAIDEAYQAKLVTYQTSRTEFNQAAKGQLRSYEHEI
ncbi:hypothetical protein [Vibrio cholerae]|nr:hypothetical protein [Vibrio cholerae]